MYNILLGNVLLVMYYLLFGNVLLIIMYYWVLSVKSDITVRKYLYRTVLLQIW